MELLDSIRKWLNTRELSIPVALLVVAFGWSSWLAVNGLWLQLPIMMLKVPESFQLASYLVVIIQLANIGPLIFTLGYKFFPNVFKELPIIYGLLGFGGFSCFLLSFVWDKTTVIGGNEHASALLTLTFFLSFVDCSSSVTFLPYMAHFKKNYMSSFFIGAGLSALIPAIVALGQGTGSNGNVCYKTKYNVITNSTSTNATTMNTTSPNSTSSKPLTLAPTEPSISVGAFFFFLFVMVVFSILAFIALNIWSKAKNEKVPVDGEENDEPRRYETSPLGINEGPFNDNETGDRESSLPDKETHSKSSLVSGVYSTTVEDTNAAPDMSLRGILFLLVLQGWLNGIVNGVVPSIQPYACQPYGANVYHITLILQAIANPVACFLYQWIELQNVLKIVAMSFVYTILAIYVVVVGGNSPCPPMNSSAAGGVIIVMVCTVAMGIVSYLKLAISSLMRNQGKKALLWCGVSIQVGSLVGAISTFLVVTVDPQFTYPDACAVCR